MDVIILFTIIKKAERRYKRRNILPAIPGIKLENPPLLFFANSDFNFS